MYFIGIINILVDDKADVNKVHLKFYLYIYLICLRFSPAIRCYYLDWFLLKVHAFFIRKTFIRRNANLKLPRN